MKKKYFFLAVFALLTTTITAQVPQFFQYQCVVRDISGTAVVNQPVNFQISIISGSQTGTVEYTETHSSATNDYGIVTLQIGNGSPVTGSFSTINWSNQAHYVKVEADLSGGTVYTDMGTTQLLSVPYALYSQFSGSSATGITWLGTLLSHPPSPTLNNAYYNSVDGMSYIFDGTTWQIMTVDGTDGIQGIQGIQGDQGIQGIPGQDGVSITWLGSFASAPPSPTINDAYYNSADGISYIYNGSTWQILAQDGAQGSQGIQGIQGIQGEQGLQGIAGMNGISVSWLGTFASAPPSPSLNEAYYNSTDGISYIYNGSTWQVLAQDGAQGLQGIQGVQGIQGIQGNPGQNGISIIWLGSFASAPPSPSVNNAYYNSTDKKSYIWNGSAWQMIVQDGANGADGIDGTDGVNGTDGKTVLSGTVNPIATQGVNGDFYINTATNTIFGPKTGGVWGAGTSLTGPQGIAGTNGTNGVDGRTVLSGTTNPTTQGSDGDYYINTSTNYLFGPKTAGAWGSGVSLVGPQGPQGTQGPAGTGLTNRGNWLSGTTYSNGDYVFDRSTDDPLVNSMWICQVPSFVSTIQPFADPGNWVEFQAPAGPQGDAGTNGTDGKTVLNGTVNPTTEGVNGDFYINTSTNTIFGPKTAGTWGAGTSLVGPQGTAGTNGTNGYSVLSGSSNPTTQGVNGDFYINTTTNTIFGPKTGGVWGSGTSLVGPPGTYTAGAGIQISGGTITNTAPDQTVTISNGSGISVTGGYPAFTVTNASPNATHTGDVTGSGALTIANNAVTTLKISDGNVTAAKLNNMGAAGGQVLKYNGANWAPANEVSYSAGTGLSLAGTTFSAQTTTALWNANQFQGRSVSSAAPTNGQVLAYNGTSWAPANQSSYTAGTGLSLSGTTFNALTTSALWNANQLQGRTVSSTAPSSGQILKYSGTSWDPATETTYSAGTGMTLSGTTFNAQTTTALWNANQLQSRSVTSTAPTNGQVLKYNGTSWAPSSDLNAGTPGGVNKSVQYNNNGAFGGNSNFIWDNTNERLGIGLANPAGRVVIQGSSTAAATEPLFEIKNRSGQQVMVVYEDSVHFYISDDILMSNKGGFAVSGRNNSKALTNDFLRVSPDSTRIYTGDTIKGFGVKNIGATSKGSYLQLTHRNYFIGHDAGKSILNTGVYNSFMGYKSGRSTTSGDNNVYMGYMTGYSNTTGGDGVFLGYKAGYSNTSGSDNVFVGKNTGYSNTAGYSNTFAGEAAGYSNTTGNYNSFYGYYSGRFNLTGNYNVNLGYYAGYNNSVGNYNVLIGGRSGYFMDSASYNVMIGNYSGYKTDNGGYNTMIGYQTGYDNTSGEKNVYMGYRAGYNSTTSSNNTFIGTSSGYTNTTGDKNVFVGFSSGGLNTTGYKNIFIGNTAGYGNTTGNQNICIGDSSGTVNAASFNIFMGTSSGQKNTSGTGNTFIGNQTGMNNIAGSFNTTLGWIAGAGVTGDNNVCLGSWSAWSGASGSDNVFIGFFAGGTNSGSNNVFVGQACGNGNGGSGNVFLGNNVNLSGSNKLAIDNSGTTSPLIYGEFDNDIVKINGKIGANTTPSYYVHSVDNTVSSDAPAVYGLHYITDNFGVGVRGDGKYRGVYGYGNTASGNSTGVYGTASGAGTGNRYGVYGTASGGATAYAGYFSGNVNVTGTLAKGGGSFKIDHPLDPENKFLYHSFVESPDMKNIYDGVAVLGSDGRVEIQLPDYFETLNKDFRYIFSPIGAPMPDLYIEQEVTGNKFIIAGGIPGKKVSWQVTGIRKDPFAEKYRIPVDVEKNAEEKGLYLYPELYDKGIDKGIDYKHNNEKK